MAPSKPAVDLNAMINADRTRRKNEILAKEIFGKNRRASAPGGGMNKRSNNNKSGAVPSLASRIGVFGSGVAKQRSASTTVRSAARPSGRLQADGNVDAEWTHDLHAINNPAASRTLRANPRGPSAARINRNERIHSALNGPALSPSLSSQFNIIGTAKPVASISIRGLAGPSLIVVKNLAAGTTAADLESAMMPVGGTVLSCRITSERPNVVAELVFETREGADNVVDTFNNQNADGNLLHVFHQRGPLPAYAKQLTHSSHAHLTSIPQGPRADFVTNRSDAARSGHEDDRYAARERSRERRRDYGRDDVIDGSYGFEDRMETDDAESRGLYSDNIISRKGRGIAYNRDRDNRGDGRKSYR
ncbi:hypothetical protein QTJ16_001657 [Diplocarpon rosae]|uniref:RRM domain-containing protein n=1 Tax=Diplocarpon rosae TaxID=946125 RepID=A0AAD9T4Q8_9HELO|nr:hypothetical protein QTJ16_001657 [Diplocarpon rosae]PBP16599.1 hypothetical protein BUE80_DR012657 [Diplocarpon rosae]